MFCIYIYIYIQHTQKNSKSWLIENLSILSIEVYCLYCVLFSLSNQTPPGAHPPPRPPNENPCSSAFCHYSLYCLHHCSDALFTLQFITCEQIPSQSLLTSFITINQIFTLSFLDQNSIHSFNPNPFFLNF